MGGHRELCLVGMRGGPWDSLVEGQCLVTSTTLILLFRLAS